MSTDLELRSSCTAPSPATDHGFSLVEIIVAVVLLGLATTGTITTLWTTVRASVTQRDLTNAQVWLQGAMDALQAAPREDCDDDGPAGEAQQRLHDRYEAVAKVVGNPDGWPAANITVDQPVRLWDGDQYQLVCYDDKGINLQLITVRVTSPSNKVVRTLQVVKGA